MTFGKEGESYMLRTHARPRNAFTLIELLIVVAIIAILAAIAVPNFLEAQVRSKVSRVKSDLRTQATAIEAYAVDWNHLPRDNDSDLDRETAMSSVPFNEKANGSVQLTTPVAYMTSILTDPFTAGGAVTNNGGVALGYRIGSGDWSYGVNGGAIAQGAEAPSDSQDSGACIQKHDGWGGQVKAYVTLSPGPDQARARCAYKCFPWNPYKHSLTSDQKANQPNFYLDYDPTNGTVSAGDIYRFGGNFLQGDWDRNAYGAGPRGPEQN